MQASAVPATEQNAPSQAGTTEPAPPSAGMHAHGEPPVVSAQPPQLEPHEQRTSPDTTGSQSPSVTPEPARPNPPSGAQSMDEPPVAVPPQQTVPSGQAQPNASMSSPKADASETPTVEQIGNSALELSRMTLQYVNSTPNLQDDPVGLEIARLAMEIAQRAQQIEQRQQQAMPEQAATAMPTEPQTQAPLSPEPVPLTQSAATATPSTPETVPTLEQDPVGRLEAIAAQLSQAAALQQETLLQTAPEQVAVQRSMPEQPAQATPQAMPEGMITAKSEPQHFTDIGSDIAATAREWAGRDYKPGESERCQDFVNHVLNSTQPGLADRIGTTQQAIDGLESGELLASRFFGDDVSRKVSDLSQAKPGDIVGFANTYGDYPAGTITHVGIYVGDGMVVDRPTADRPVQLRSIETFGADNFVIVRPDAYENVKSLKSDADVEPQNATSKSMSNHANVASLDSSIVPSTILAAEKGTILISSSDHPDNALYQQALKGVKMLPDTMIASQEQSERMAAAIVLEAKSGGLQQVAGVVAHPNGSGLFVVDKQDMADPSAKRVFVDAQMASRPLSETNQMIDQTGKQPPSPSQPESRDESERRVGMMVA
jgi:hypothetical protein